MATLLLAPQPSAASVLYFTTVFLRGFFLPVDLDWISRLLPLLFLCRITTIEVAELEKSFGWDVITFL